MPRKPELTDRQKLFVAEYPRDLNMTRAAERAGYKHPKQLGTKLMSLPHVKDALVANMERRIEKLDVDADWVLKNAVAVYHRVVQEVKPALHAKYRTQLTDNDGNLLFTFDSSAALRALELVGKHIDVQAFKEKIEVDAHEDLKNILRSARQQAGIIDASGEPRVPIIDVTPEPSKSAKDKAARFASELAAERKPYAALTDQEKIARYPGGKMPEIAPCPRVERGGVVDSDFDPLEA